MNKIRFITVFLVFFAFSVGGLFAQQNAQELRAGREAAGNLEKGGEVWYRVRPSSTGLLTVETLGNLDTYLMAYDSNNNLLEENDDGYNDFNAFVQVFVESGKDYFFKLTGYDETESGPYRIRSSIEQAQELRSGRSVRVSIDEEEYNLYFIKPSRAGKVLIETTGNTDTIMAVVDIDAIDIIAEDDDGGTGLNSRVEFNAEANKTYLIILSAFESGPSSITATY